jgi:hypothetical protein
LLLVPALRGRQEGGASVAGPAADPCLFLLLVG